MAQEENDEDIIFPPSCTMRDIHDYCKSHHLPSLSQGMIELPPPAILRRIAGEVCNRDDVHTYRNRWGENEYRQALQVLLKKHYNTDVPMDAILAAQGVFGAATGALLLLRARGKKRVGLVEPFYTYHVKQVETAFMQTPEFIKSHDDFSPDWDRISQAVGLTPTTDGGATREPVDVIIVTNPGNPHGRVWRKDELQKLVQICNEKDVGLVLDECYIDMVWGDRVHYSPVQDALHENVFCCRGFSKVLGAQSWRVGYCISHPKSIAEMMPYHDYAYICVPFVQHAIAQYFREHYDDFQEHAAAVGALMQRNWTVLSKALQQAFGWTPVDPEGSMYGMLLHHNTSDLQACIDALDKGHGVGVCPGYIFYGGNPPNTGYVRIHCGVSEQAADAIVERLHKIAQKRKATHS